MLKNILGCKDEELMNQINILNLNLIEKDATIQDLNKRINSLLNQTINPPASLGKLSNNDVYNVLHPLCDTLFLSDVSYDLTSKDLGKAYTLFSKIWTEKWVNESHDCDNFSYELAGYWSESLKSFAFGIVWSTNHAFNIMIDENKKVWIVEPQTSNFITIEEAKKDSRYYPWRFVLM